MLNVAVLEKTMREILALLEKSPFRVRGMEKEHIGYVLALEDVYYLLTEISLNAFEVDAQERKKCNDFLEKVNAQRKTRRMLGLPPFDKAKIVN